VVTGQVGVNRICSLVGISKATYYHAKHPNDRLQEKYCTIKGLITEIIEAHPAYGIRRIKAELKETYKVTIGKDALGKLLKLWGLGFKRTIKKKQPTMIQKILIALAGRANLLIRTKLTQPFQAISSDISVLYFKGGKAYLCTHKDVYGQMVYGWSLELSMETSVVMSSFTMAIKNMQRMIGKIPKMLLFHQDRGSQFTSYEYVEAVLSVASLSYSNPGTPTHNSGQESFFGRFKDEWKDQMLEIETFEELKRFVAEKIFYYNYERRHTSIGYISPNIFTKSFLTKTC